MPLTICETCRCKVYKGEFEQDALIGMAGLLRLVKSHRQPKDLYHNLTDGKLKEVLDGLIFLEDWVGILRKP